MTFFSGKNTSSRMKLDRQPRTGAATSCYKNVRTCHYFVTIFQKICVVELRGTLLSGSWRRWYTKSRREAQLLINYFKWICFAGKKYKRKYKHLTLHFPVRTTLIHGKPRTGTNIDKKCEVCPRCQDWFDRKYEQLTWNKPSHKDFLKQNLLLFNECILPKQ